MKQRAKAAAVSFVIFLSLTAALVFGTSYIENINKIEGRQLLEQAVKNAVVECYAVEGVYPSTLDYLEKWYGIKFDKEKYSIGYLYYSVNMIPEVIVHEKWGGVNE